MPVKLVTYNSQNYAGTLGSGLVTIAYNSLKVMVLFGWNQLFSIPDKAT